jgi:hypothetical protein
MMRSATIGVTIAWMLASSPFCLAFPQTAPTQSPSPQSATSAPAATTSPAAAAPQPCPAVSPSQPSSSPDCTLAGKGKSHKSAQTPAATPASSPSKKVVRNGSTTDPSVDISPGVSPQQASQQRDKTTWLLGKTDENLRTLASRQLNPAQQDTVDQIKRYVEESQTATKNGDLQRAYTLAKKARILSRDLAKR